MSRHLLFAPVPDGLIHDKQVGAGGVRLYSLLMRFANKDRTCWPRQSRLAAEMEYSRRTIERLIAQLRETGWITVERRENGGVCQYTMHREKVSVPCVPPDRNDGRVPTEMTGGDIYIEREPLNESHREKNTSCSPPPPRAAVRREAKVARDREDALDPAKALDLWDAPVSLHGARADRVIYDEVSLIPRPPARRSPSADSPMGLALAWRARMQEARVAGALDTNVKALARLFRVLLDEQVTPAQIRAMTDLYAAAGGLRNPAVAPWRHFVFQRHLLLSKIREDEAQQRRYQDPDAYVYTPPTREQRLEADRAYQLH